MKIYEIEFTNKTEFTTIYDNVWRVSKLFSSLENAETYLRENFCKYTDLYIGIVCYTIYEVTLDSDDDVEIIYKGEIHGGDSDDLMSDAPYTVTLFRYDSNTTDLIYVDSKECEN